MSQSPMSRLQSSGLSVTIRDNAYVKLSETVHTYSKQLRVINVAGEWEETEQRTNTT